MRRSVTVLFFFAAAVFFAGCSKSKTIDLSHESYSDLAPGYEWAVVKVPYVAFRSGCGYSDTITGHARNGDIFLVKGSRFAEIPVEADENTSKKKSVASSEKILWYEFDKGWLDQNSVTIYDTKLKAQSAAEKIVSN